MAYIPNTDQDRAKMLAAIGVNTLDDLFSQIPGDIRLDRQLDIPMRLDQIGLSRRMTALSRLNKSAEEYPCFLGAGVYDHYVPPTVGAITGRSEFYTAYTPYQPEMSQGMLQTIYEFQTMIAELTAMDVANASMYDGATALAEAALMARDLTGRTKVAVLTSVSPYYTQVVQTYCDHIGITLEFVKADEASGVSQETAAVIVQQPNFYGHLEEAETIFAAARQAGALAIASIDPVSLGVLKPPGEYGADIVVGEGQGLGCPMGFGGPMLGIFACRSQYMRRLPGRIVGETHDADGKRAYVMTLRTREQDIRRERATSNICTNEALYALAATVYLATMGRRGLAQVANLCTQKAHYAAEQIAALPGYALMFPDAPFFKEFAVLTPSPAAEINDRLLDNGIIGGLPITHPVSGKEGLLLCVTEQRTREEIDKLCDVMCG